MGDCQLLKLFTDKVTKGFYFDELDIPENNTVLPFLGSFSYGEQGFCLLTD